MDDCQLICSQRNPCTSRVELLTNEARQSLRFDVAPMGYGQAIICVDVAPGSEAEEVGGKPVRLASPGCMA